MASAQQELYDWFFSSIYDEVTTNVYDYLPGTDVEYPFVYVGNVYTTTSGTKTSRDGTFTIYIDVWGTLKQRMQVTDLADKIFYLLKKRIKTEHFKFYVFPQSQQIQITQEDGLIRASLILELERN